MYRTFNALPPRSARLPPMKLHADKTTLNAVTAYGSGWIEINGERHAHSVVLAPEGPVQRWDVEEFAALSAEHFSGLLSLQPELVLFGSGGRQRFPHPRLTAALAHERIGVEVMDTQAACRTYNILAAEGRRVIAALITP